MFYVHIQDNIHTLSDPEISLDIWSPEVAQRGMEGADEEGRPAEPQPGDGEAVDDSPGLSACTAPAGV